MSAPLPYRPNLPLLLLACAVALLFTAARVDSVDTSHPAPAITTYTFDRSAGVLSAIAALAILAAAIHVARAPIRWFRLAALLPALLSVGMGFMAVDGFRSHVTVTPTSATLPATGLFPRPHPIVHFARLDYASLRENEIEFVQKDSTRLASPRGTLLRAALPELRQRLDDAGVFVVLRD